MSLYGVDPWYGGRWLGCAGRGRLVNGRAVYDSTACVSTSKPQAATTPPGRLSVVVGSTKARLGLSRGEAMPVFSPADFRSRIAMPVVSLPVPHVVGQAMC